MSTPFTDIDAAIEEARYLREYYGKHYKVVQKNDGNMYVHQCEGEPKERIIRKLFTTRHDKSQPNNRRWTKAEMAIMESKAGEYDARTMARKLKRSEYSITTRAKLMGLSLAVRSKKWTDEDDNKLLAMIGDGAKAKEMSENLDRTEQSVRWRMKTLKKTLNSTFC